MDALSDVLGATTSSSSGSRSNALAQEDFFEIMISELTNQDPLEPMDNQQFLNQLVQMQTLQATTKLSEGIESLLLGQQIASAGSLIGRQIEGEDADGNPVSGTVQSVVVQDGDVLLGLENRLLPLSSVTEIQASAETA
ncbi:MAG: hypothetical protein KDC38_20080 [Planctomycetes bacterium]|nr:hypothetical protein [Planctomycetota bacterium]